jgi:hypothetical protein
MRPLRIIKQNEIIELIHFKKIASNCLFGQLISIFTFIFCYSILKPSNQIAISCGILAILISLTPLFYALSIKNLAILFSCISIFNLAPIWFLYLEGILPGYDAYEYSPAIFRIEALIYTSLFQIFINLFYLLFWNKITTFSVKFFSFLRDVKITANSYSKLSLISFFTPLVIFYFYHGSFQKLWAVFIAGRSEGNSGSLLTQDSGGISSFLLPIIWLWQLTPFFSSIAFISFERKKSVSAIFPIILGLLVIFQSFLGGTRAMMIYVATPFIFFLFYYNWNRGIKFWLFGISILLSLIALMEFQLRFRNETFIDVFNNLNKAEKSQGLNSATTFDLTHTQRDNNMYLFCLLLKGYPKKYHFEGYSELFAEIANPIPRAFWKNKPILQGAKDLIYQYPAVIDGPIFMGTTSLTYSVVGEAYMDGGSEGILVYALLYAPFLLFFDGLVYYARSRQPLPVGILGCSVFLAFWSYRALFSLVSYIYPLLLLIIFLRFILIKKRNLH